MPSITIEKEIEVEVDAAELASRLSYETAFDFIKTIEEEMGDWDFTKKLIKWAAEKKEECIKDGCWDEDEDGPLTPPLQPQPPALIRNLMVQTQES